MLKNSRRCDIIYLRNKIFRKARENHMENKLRILDNLENIREHNKVALEGDFVCECGNQYFRIYHSGKQTRGILAPYLVKKNHQIVIETKCTCCENSIVIFDSGTDGTSRSAPSNTPRNLLNISNDADAYKIHFICNYFEANFKTNLFEDCFIEIYNSQFKKPRRLYEGW